MQKGKLVIISGPSGVGKGTVCNEIVRRNDNFVLSVSATTRQIRPGEVDGVNYHFITKEEFLKKIENNDFIEWAKYLDNYYGTLMGITKEKMDRGRYIILEIDVEGAKQIKDKVEDAISIFLIPPSAEELKNRLIKRGTETEDLVNKRLKRAESELKYKDHYDYIIVNNILKDTVDEIMHILEKA